jgi:hypothetical protein
MLDMSKIEIRRTGPGGDFGAPIDCDDMPHVADAVENAVIETDEDEGKVVVGGQLYSWKRG